MKRSYGVLAFLLPFGAEPYLPRPLPLTVGSTLSPFILAYLKAAAPHPLPASFLTGKKLVFELRAFPTGSLIAVFPRLQAAIPFFTGRLHPIIITKDTTEYHRAYTHCRTGLQPLELSLLTADSALAPLFTACKHPQLLYLDHTGRVLSLIQGFYITHENLRTALQSTGRFTTAKPLRSSTIKTTVS